MVPCHCLEEQVQLVVEAGDLECDAALRRVEAVSELGDLGRVQLLHHQEARAVHQEVQAHGVLHRSTGKSINRYNEL